MAAGEVDSKTLHPYVSLCQRGHHVGWGETLLGFSFVALPFVHQAKSGRRDFKVLLVSSLERFLMPVILSLHTFFVAEVLFLRAFREEPFT